MPPKQLNLFQTSKKAPRNRGLSHLEGLVSEMRRKGRTHVEVTSSTMMFVTGNELRRDKSAVYVSLCDERIVSLLSAKTAKKAYAAAKSTMVEYSDRIPA